MRWSGPSDSDWSSTAVSSSEPAQEEAQGADTAARFTAIQDEAGLDFTHDNGSDGRKYMVETLGAGGGMLRSSPLTSAVTSEKKENELVSFLRAQLAEAINLQDKDLIARLHETIRCLTVFNNYE